MAVFGNVFSPSISLQRFDNEGQTSVYMILQVLKERKMKGKMQVLGYFVLLGFSNWPHLELVLFISYLDVLPDDTDR